MITLLLLTLFAWVGNGCIAKVLWFSTQHDQWIDQLLGWQKMVEKFGNKSGVFNTILYKALGGCEFCFAHAVSFLSFWIYVVILAIGFEAWPWFPNPLVQWIFNFAWYILYVSTATVVSSLTINRL